MKLRGTIPQSIGNLTSLQYLYVRCITTTFTYTYSFEIILDPSQVLIGTEDCLA